jgi:hypothetical protein
MENVNDNLENQNSTFSNLIDEQKVISIEKFIFLSIVSFGIYEIWWVYKVWKFYKQKEKSDIFPFARTIFSIFYLPSLFEKNLVFAQEKGYQDSYSPQLLFGGFIGMNFLSRLPDPFWLISMLSFLLIIPPFKALNFALKNSTEFKVTEETSFSSRQIALIVIGLIWWVLVIVALTIDE